MQLIFVEGCDYGEIEPYVAWQAGAVLRTPRWFSSSGVEIILITSVNRQPESIRAQYHHDIRCLPDIGVHHGCRTFTCGRMVNNDIQKVEDGFQKVNHAIHKVDQVHPTAAIAASG